jgi:hypothetical protein
MDGSKIVLVSVGSRTLDGFAMMLARFNFSDDINGKFLTNNYSGASAAMQAVPEISRRSSPEPPVTSAPLT